MGGDRNLGFANRSTESLSKSSFPSRFKPAITKVRLSLKAPALKGFFLRALSSYDQFMDCGLAETLDKFFISAPKTLLSSLLRQDKTLLNTTPPPANKSTKKSKAISPEERFQLQVGSLVEIVETESSWFRSRERRMEEALSGFIEEAIGKDELEKARILLNAKVMLLQMADDAIFHYDRLKNAGSRIQYLKQNSTGNENIDWPSFEENESYDGFEIAYEIHKRLDSFVKNFNSYVERAENLLKIQRQENLRGARQTPYRSRNKTGPLLVGI